MLFGQGFPAQFCYMPFSQTIVQFTPQEDVTVYELAQCIQYLVKGVFDGAMVDKAYFDSLPTTFTRHFTATEVNPPGGGGGEG